MATYINLTGEDITVVGEDTAEHTVFPASTIHEPLGMWLDQSTANETTDDVVVIDEHIVNANARVTAGMRRTFTRRHCIVNAAARVTGLKKLCVERGVTYIVTREVALILDGLNREVGKAPFDFVYPDGWGEYRDDGADIDDSGVKLYSGLVRLVI